MRETRFLRPGGGGAFGKGPGNSDQQRRGNGNTAQAMG